MAIKKLCLVGLLNTCLLSVFPAHAEPNPFGQVVQINTRLQSVVDKPTWLLIVRNVDTGLVLPYVFDFKNSDENFWLALTYSRSYRITASSLKFGSYTINNFCHLEGGIISGESVSVRLTGNLTPDPRTSQCYVSQYKTSYFPIAGGGS